MITIIDIENKDNFTVTNINPPRYSLVVDGGDNDHNMKLVVELDNQVSGESTKLILCNYEHMRNAKFARMDSVIGSCQDFIIAHYKDLSMFVNPAVVASKVSLVNSIMQIINDVDASIKVSESVVEKPEQGEENNG